MTAVANLVLGLPPWIMASLAPGISNFKQARASESRPFRSTPWFLSATEPANKPFQNQTCRDLITKLGTAQDPSAQRVTLLQKVIEINRGRGVAAEDLDGILDQCLVILLAALDTSAWAIATSLYNILRHPDVLRRVREEIDAVSSDDLIALCNLPYLVRWT